MLDAANEASSEQVSSTQLLRPEAAGSGGWFRPEAQDGGPPAEIARMEGRSREKKGESFGERLVAISLKGWTVYDYEQRQRPGPAGRDVLPALFAAFLPPLGAMAPWRHVLFDGGRSLPSSRHAGQWPWASTARAAELSFCPIV